MYVFTAYHENEGKNQRNVPLFFFFFAVFIIIRELSTLQCLVESGPWPFRLFHLADPLFSEPRMPIVQLPSWRWDIFAKFIVTSWTKPEFES